MSDKTVIVHGDNSVNVTEKPTRVSVTQSENSVSVTEEKLTVTVATHGLQGPPGPQGPSGAAGGSAVVHVQSTPVPSWGISHSFGREPNVVVIIDDEYVMADVQYPTLTTVVINFGEPQTGKAILT